MSEDLCAFGPCVLTSISPQLAAHHTTNEIPACSCYEDPSFVPQVMEE
ncbi:hypothetical protein HJC23_011013 [Cyclotella cryptica]|uniref:Uncharacterized protein n=1 Tax=Cyclotella cryptica TaxID=29204 RepID=A0ABD3PEV6_9STRA